MLMGRLQWSPPRSTAHQAPAAGENITISAIADLGTVVAWPLVPGRLGTAEESRGDDGAHLLDIGGDALSWYMPMKEEASAMLFCDRADAEAGSLSRCRRRVQQPRTADVRRDGPAAWQSAC